MSIHQTLIRESTVKRIIIYCSGMPWGTRESIGHEHRQRRGWREIGYHFVVENGYSSQEAVYKDEDNGRVVVGRALDKEADMAIQICLVGKNNFTRRQYYYLAKLCLRLQETYQVPTEKVLGEHEVHEHTMSATLDMTLFRLLIEDSPLLHHKSQQSRPR